MAVTVKVIGIEEINRMFKQLDKVSQTVVTKSAKAGANIAYKQAKRDAPVKTGALRKGIIMKAEKRITGKKVYDIKFSNNPVFIKESKDEFEVTKGRGKNKKTVMEKKRAFYPVSQEYGWMTKSGKKIIPKKAGFLRNAIRQNRENIRQIMIKVMADKLREVVS